VRDVPGLNPGSRTPVTATCLKAFIHRLSSFRHLTFGPIIHGSRFW
jgi:hypothetical protein